MSSIQSHFTPLSSDPYTDKNRWETTQIGRVVEVHTEDFFPNLNSAEIAIFNIPEYEVSQFNHLFKKVISSKISFGKEILKLTFCFVLG